MCQGISVRAVINFEQRVTRGYKLIVRDIQMSDGTAYQWGDANVIGKYFGVVRTRIYYDLGQNNQARNSSAQNDADADRIRVALKTFSRSIDGHCSSTN